MASPSNASSRLLHLPPQAALVLALVLLLFSCFEVLHPCADLFHLTEHSAPCSDSVPLGGAQNGYDQVREAHEPFVGGAPVLVVALRIEGRSPDGRPLQPDSPFLEPSAPVPIRDTSRI